MKAATAVLAAILIAVGGSTLALAEEGLGDPAAVIDLPPGITMASFEGVGDPGSATVSGCPVGGTVSVREYLSTPLGGSQSQHTSISFAPAIDVPADGGVSVPLRHISTWLALAEPAAGSVVVIEARCGFGGPWATQTISRGIGLGSGAPVSAEPTDDTAAPPVAAEPDASVFVALIAGSGLVLVLVGVLVTANFREVRRG